MIKFFSIVLVASLLIALCSVHLRQVETEFSAKLLHGTEQAETTHVFTNFILTTTDKNGLIESVIQSPNTRYVVNEKKTHLTTPNMLIYRENKSAINLQANSATVDHATNITRLDSNVEVTMEENNPLRMTTQTLTIDNDQRFAKNRCRRQHFLRQ